MGAQCMFRERPSSESALGTPQTVQYVSLRRPKWLLGFNGRRRRLEQTPDGDDIALARSVNQAVGQLKSGGSQEVKKVLQN